MIAERFELACEQWQDSRMEDEMRIWKVMIFSRAAKAANVPDVRWHDCSMIHLEDRPT